MKFKTKTRYCTAVKVVDESAETIEKVREFLGSIEIKVGRNEFDNFYIEFINDVEIPEQVYVGDYIVYDDEYCCFFVVDDVVFEKCWEVAE